MKPIFRVAKLVSGPASEGNPIIRPWFIVETVLTSDGPRDRICDGRWHTQEAAELILVEKVSRQ